MLTTSVLFSVHRPSVIPSNLPNKDINIFTHILEPVPKLNTACKKSSTSPNCLTVSATHIFAAQSDKAVVQIYDREKGTKDADVPFGEKIASCLFIGLENGGGVGILVLGMEGGRLILWEVCTGRQVSTPPAHLEAVTCLAVDSTRNFLLSGSKDHNVHVWKLADLLSFSTASRSPYQTLSMHRGAITSLVVGHSQLADDFVITASEDKTVSLWNYRTAIRLATFLVTSIPTCLAIDPADRAFYIGTHDSMQFVDLQDVPMGSTNEAIELGDEHKWQDEQSLLCLSVSSDGTNLFTGHQNGKVMKRTTPRGQPALVYDTHLPVSNIISLEPRGFPNQKLPTTRPAIVKPKLDMAVKKDENLLPERYELHTTFTSSLSTSRIGSQPQNDMFSDFDAILEHPSFPDDLLYAPLISTSKSKASELDEDDLKEFNNLKQENAAAVKQIDALTSELKRLREVDLAKQRSKKLRRIRRSKALEALQRQAMGVTNGDVSMDNGDENMSDVSSDTDQ